MSVVVACHTRCDRCRHAVGPIVIGPSVQRPAARKAALEEGWTHTPGRDGQDLCPRCTAEVAS